MSPILAATRTPDDGALVSCAEPRHGEHGQRPIDQNLKPETFHLKILPVLAVIRHDRAHWLIECRK